MCRTFSLDPELSCWHHISSRTIPALRGLGQFIYPTWKHHHPDQGRGRGVGGGEEGEGEGRGRRGGGGGGGEGEGRGRRGGGGEGEGEEGKESSFIYTLHISHILT